jgi:ATP-dependent helicase/nuclease subunit A
MTNTALSLQTLHADPTTQQRAASDPSVSVWVNASAGSGKTSILTKRVTRLLLSGVKPQRILCLTFTRAAAAEMSLRIMKELSQWAICTDNDLNASLSELQGRPPHAEEMTRARRLFAEALACPGGMRIRTLHAFGQEILRRFPVESNLPPHFTVIEEEDARALQDDTVTDLLRESASTPDSAVAKGITALIETLGEKSFREAVHNLLREKQRLAATIATHGSLDILIAKSRAALGLQPQDTQESLKNTAFTFFDENEIRTHAKYLLEGTPSYVKRGEAILQWLQHPPERRRAAFAKYTRFFLKEDGKPFKNYADKTLLKKYPDIETVFRNEAAHLQTINERIATAANAELTAATLTFGNALIARYSATKRRRAALDYDDLVNETLNLLQRPGIAPWILHKLDEGLDHLLVDEAQDTSRAQWDIVATLADEFFAGAGARTNNRTLFVVGDEKQSIYSFQNADPEAFAAMRSYFKKKIAAAERKLDEIPLHVSFRSAPAILRAVDATFARDEAAAGVSATTVEHVAFKQNLPGHVELWPLMPQPGDREETVWELPLGYEIEHDPQAELADNIASLIKIWLERGETIHDEKEGRRPLCPGDIMILLRRRGRFADLMVRALKQKPNNIPVTGVDRMRLMEQLPVMDLLALTQFALLPEDDLNLANILRGPLLNLSEDNLMNLAANRGNATLWQHIKQIRHSRESRNPAASDSGHITQTTVDNEKLQQVENYLTALLNKADFTTPFALLTHILNEPCPASPISGRRAIWTRLGLDALDPIEELLTAAQNFSRRHPPSLQNFLHALAVGDSEIKRELDNGKEGAGQVRIMTIHASKGLEAPIVFLPDTATIPRQQDIPKFQWDETGLPFYINSKPESGPLRRLWDTAREKQMQEYRRLLYVAMTRASQRLYIGGWELKKSETDSDQSWHNLVKNGLQKSEPHAQATEDTIVWEDPILRTEPKPQTEKPTNIIPLPAWAFEQAAPEKAATQTLSPSKLAAAPSAATPDQAFARGRIIHRLLQSLPDIEDAHRETVAARFLAHPQYALTKPQQAEVQEEVLKLLRTPEFKPLFAADSRAEVPLAGTINGNKIAGQVDRLALHENEVWIVDYKTNRPPPNDAAGIPEAYSAQMEAYRAVLREIYPDRTIRCFLLWTYGPKLMEVSV